MTARDRRRELAELRRCLTVIERVAAEVRDGALDSDAPPLLASIDTGVWLALRHVFPRLEEAIRAYERGSEIRLAVRPSARAPQWCMHCGGDHEPVAHSSASEAAALTKRLHLAGRQVEAQHWAAIAGTLRRREDERQEAAQ